MTIIFIIIFDTNLFIFIRLMQIYIPAISIPSDKILKKKKEIISFITIALSSDFELNTNNLFVMNANNTDKIQAIRLLM